MGSAASENETPDIHESARRIHDEIAPVAVDAVTAAGWRPTMPEPAPAQHDAGVWGVVVGLAGLDAHVAELGESKGDQVWDIWVNLSSSMQRQGRFTVLNLTDDEDSNLVLYHLAFDHQDCEFARNAMVETGIPSDVLEIATVEETFDRVKRCHRVFLGPHHTCWSCADTPRPEEIPGPPGPFAKLFAAGQPKEAPDA